MNTPPRTTIVWLAGAKAEVLRCYYLQFERSLDERELGPDEKSIARNSYLLGMLDAHGIVHPSAMLDALSKITRDPSFADAFRKDVDEVEALATAMRARKQGDS